MEDRIWPVGDHDFFELLLPGAGRLEIRHRVPSAIGSALRLHDERGPLTPWHDRATGKEQVLVVDLRRGGQRLPRGGRHPGQRRQQGELRFSRIISLPVSDAWEPNDSRERARTKELPVEIEGRLFPAGDLDRFRFVATERGLVEIEALAVPGPMRLRLETRTGRPLLNWSLVKKAGEKRLVSWPGWGEFHVSLRADEGRKALFDPWKIALRFHPKRAEAEEGNDRPSRARLLPFNARRTARILPRGDRDLWKCYVAGYGRVSGSSRRHPRRTASSHGPAQSGGRSLCGGWASSAGNATLSVAGEVNGWGWVMIHVDCPGGRATSLGSYGIRAEFIQRQWVHGQQAPRVHTERFGWPEVPEAAAVKASPVTSGEIDALIGDGEDPFGSIDDEW